MPATIIRLAPPVISQPKPDAKDRVRKMRRAFVDGRAASLNAPATPCPYEEAELQAEWRRGFNDGAGKPEKIRQAKEAGRKAALLNPTAQCPYAEFQTFQDELRLAWIAGWEEGSAIAERTAPDELAWGRGWYAGCYDPESPPPYHRAETLYDDWYRGACAGAAAAAQLLQEFGRGCGVRPKTLGGVKAS